MVEPEEALALGLSGPTPARQRRQLGHSQVAALQRLRERIEFDVPLGEHGDVYDRFIVRIHELRESVRILQQAPEAADRRPVQFRSNNRKFVPPPRAELGHSMEAVIHHFKLWTEGFSLPDEEVYVAIESPRGEIGCYLHGTGGNHGRGAFTSRRRRSFTSARWPRWRPVT